LSFRRDAFSAVMPWQAGAECAASWPAASTATVKAIDVILSFMLTFPLGNPAVMDALGNSGSGSTYNCQPAP
jgi:hypothetical protein